MEHAGDCWHVDAEHTEEKCRARHLEYQRNFPKNFIYEEGEQFPIIIENNSPRNAQGNVRVNSITDVAASLRIYESKIDKEDYLSIGSKRKNGY